MRMMNVSCPVCQQTHPNTHMTLLDWKTAQYACPIVGQVVNINNYYPSGETIALKPGTMEDTFNDTLTQILNADTTVFAPRTGTGKLAVWGTMVKDEEEETIYMFPKGGFEQDLAGQNINGDFTSYFTFMLNGVTYTPYGVGAVPVTLETAFSHRIELNASGDQYIEFLATSNGVTANYAIPGATPGTGVVAATKSYSGTMLPDVKYVAKVDVIGGIITITYFQAGALLPATTIKLDVTGLIGSTPITTIFKSVFYWPHAITPGGPPEFQFGAGSPIWDKNLNGVVKYSTKLYYPVILMHNSPSPYADAPIAATPM